MNALRGLLMPSGCGCTALCTASLVQYGIYCKRGSLKGNVCFMLYMMPLDPPGLRASECKSQVRSSGVCVIPVHMPVGQLTSPQSV